jgi:hypothetical protein
LLGLSQSPGSSCLGRGGWGPPLAAPPSFQIPVAAHHVSSYLLPRSSSRPSCRDFFFRSAFCVPSGMERFSASASLATAEKTLSLVASAQTLPTSSKFQLSPTDLALRPKTLLILGPFRVLTGF